MLILVPTAVGVFLSGARVVTAVEGVSEHRRVGLAAEYAGHLRDLAHTLAIERDTGTWWGASTDKGERSAAYKDAQAAVKRSVSAVRADLELVDASYGDRVDTMTKRVRGGLEAIDSLQDKPDPDRFTYLIADLFRLHDAFSQVSDQKELGAQFRALGALAKIKEQVSIQRVRILRAAYDRRRINDDTVQKFFADRERLREYIAQYGNEVGPQGADELASKLNHPTFHRVEIERSRAIFLANQAVAASRPVHNLLSDVTGWFDTNGDVIQLVDQFEDEVAAEVAAETKELESAEMRNALIAGASILALLLLVLLTTVLIARSMVTPLRRLRSEALEIAGFRLPDVVRNLRLSTDAKPPVVAPISTTTEDEIAEVAQAFDEVHRQAVRLAAEEAGLRSNINAMFVNLSRRTQTLVERQISLIDGLEKGEQDGSRLADLFKLDHLATRMRRNSENLLVLAGHEPNRRRSQPAKLVDVVRASLSEVEDYERVQVKVHRATAVVGSAANDVVHLVAELVENAIQFSPRHTKVVVGSSLIEGGAALLTVVDNGIGMTQEELVEANRRLSEPPVVDVSVSRRMGLFVVGRLALRHGIRVQLRPGEGGGVVAMVLLPPVVVIQGQPTNSAPMGGRPAQKPAESARPFGGSTTGPFGSEGTGPFSREASPLQSYSGASSFGTGPVEFPSGPLDLSGMPPGAHSGTGPQPLGGTGPLPGAGSPGAGASPGANGGGTTSGGLPRRSPKQKPSETGSFSVASDSGAFTRPGESDSGGFPRPGASDSGAFSPPPVSDSGGFPRPGVSDSGGFPHPGVSDSGPHHMPSASDSGPHRMPGLSDSGSHRMPGGSDTGGHGLPGDTGPFRFGGVADTGAQSVPGPADSGPFRRTAEPAQGGDQAPSFSAWAPTATGGTYDSRYDEKTHADDPDTASMPAVDFSPLEDEGEFLPIFASVESAWFRRADPEEDGAASQDTTTAERRLPTPSRVPPVQGGGNDGWTGASDAGWRAAQAASQPAMGGVTAAGLPKRTPKANLVPGTAALGAPTPAPPAAPVSADRIRSRMSGFQQGVRRGRAEIREESARPRAEEEENS
ncbi:hypothetical protein Ssi02_16140 [Sinosporangium siamense]|uniref:histidine kinase n=1 Tax=Sinosporangium siamense TaxID=1367973 RepID=A0A919V5B4_9ACTN|nr:hypothetical protein Ssi02_16140 [Sinosporangium siamense]